MSGNQSGTPVNQEHQPQPMLPVAQAQPNTQPQPQPPAQSSAYAQPQPLGPSAYSQPMPTSSMSVQQPMYGVHPQFAGQPQVYPMTQYAQQAAHQPQQQFMYSGSPGPAQMYAAPSNHPLQAAYTMASPFMLPSTSAGFHAPAAANPWQFHPRDANVQSRRSGAVRVKWEPAGDDCAVCAEKTDDVKMFSPCYHLPFCRDCVRKISASKQGAIHCPTCNLRMTKVLSVTRMAPAS